MRKAFYMKLFSYIKLSLRILKLYERFSYNFTIPTYSSDKPLVYESIDEKLYDISVAYNNKAVILYKIGEYDMANKSIEKCLKRTKSIFGDKNINSMIPLYNKGIVLNAKGEKDKGLKYFIQVLDHFKEKEVPIEIN